MWCTTGVLFRSSAFCYVHFYAGDTQLYVSFKPGEVNAQDEAIRAMEDCIKDIRNWLIESRLLLNDDKLNF